MFDENIIARCDKVQHLLEEEHQELEHCLKGDILEKYDVLIKAETEYMRQIRRNIIQAMNYE